ncbi:MAG: hypothetical protein WC516_09450 [Patescibacteria group bacterium]|jgi:hypothetical protein
MDNQQVSFTSKLRRLALNACFGDGHFWKHPECVNYKLIYNSTDKELLETKRKICLEIFPTGVKSCRESGEVEGVTKNAKELFRLASIVHPIFTIYKKKSKIELINELTLFDFGLWYLDDGCCVQRKPHYNFRYYLCIGNTCNTQILEDVFMSKIKELFPDEKTYGTIKRNNSKASVNNKNWVIPVPIAEKIMSIAKDFYVIPNKFRCKKTSETIRKE